MLGMNRARLAILVALANYPDGAQSGQIVADVGLQSRTVVRHLLELVDDGWLTTDAPVGERQGKRLVYRTNRERIRREMAEVIDIIAPGDDEK